MKLFLDTADVNEIREINSWGVMDGVTTNPSLVARTGRSLMEVVDEICNIVDGPISVEAVELEEGPMLEEAREIAKIHPNIVVKIPMTQNGLKVVKQLAAENIKTNVTLVFSPLQALLAAKAGATFVSPFIGRLDDFSHEGMDLIGQIVSIYENYGYATEVLVASVRHPLHVLEAAMIGADVATIPFKVFQQFLKHPLTDIGIERFLADWEKVPKK